MVFSYCSFQLSQAKSGKFNPHVHVEYEWNLRQDEMDESDDDLDDKVSAEGVCPGAPHPPRVPQAAVHGMQACTDWGLGTS